MSGTRLSFLCLLLLVCVAVNAATNKNAGMAAVVGLFWPEGVLIAVTIELSDYVGDRTQLMMYKWSTGVDTIVYFQCWSSR